MDKKLLGGEWLKFINNVLLPIGAAGTVIRIIVLIANADSLPDGYVGPQILSSLISLGVCAALFFGLKQRAAWAWYLMLVTLVLSPVGAAVSRIPTNHGNQEVTATLLVVGLLCWTLPNGIYFYRRRAWFGVALKAANGTTGKEPATVPPLPAIDVPESVPLHGEAVTVKASAGADTGYAQRFISCGCGKQNPAGVKFCGACGRPMQLECPECAVNNNSENGFCQQCGLDLERYKQAKSEIDELSSFCENGNWPEALLRIKHLKTRTSEWPNSALAYERNFASQEEALTQTVINHLRQELAASQYKARNEQTDTAWNKVESLSRDLVAVAGDDQVASAALADVASGREICRFVQALPLDSFSAALARCRQFREKNGDLSVKATVNSTNHYGPVSQLEEKLQDQQARHAKAIEVVLWGATSVVAIAVTSACLFQAWKWHSAQQFYEMGMRHKNGAVTNLSEAATCFRKAAMRGHALAALQYGVCLEKGQGVPVDSKEAAKWYATSAETGNAEAQWRFGDCYQNGRGVCTNLPEAMKFYSFSAERGNADGQWKLGLAYVRGFNGETNRQAGYQWYRKACDQGNADGQRFVGVCYANGWGVETNLSKAVEYYRMSAKQNNAYGLSLLAACYSAGQGVETNKAEAERLFTLAGEHGDPRDQYFLGYRFASGYGVMKNKQKAIHWYRKAAERGDSDAQASLGECYATGKGVETNQLEAVKWTRRAAEQGNASAQERLGDFYATGFGFETNKQEALKWYREAARTGGVYYKYALGKRFFCGDGVEANKKEAVKCYLEIATNRPDSVSDEDESMLTRGGVLEGAQNALGDCYADGDGVEKDLRISADWYLKSAMQSNAYAQYRLGVYYAFNAENYIRNNYQAVDWFRKAANNRNGRAQYFLGYFYENGRGVESNLEEAVNWYQVSATNKDPVGECQLGVCYELGRGITPDKKKAAQFYLKSAKQDWTEAYWRYGDCLQYGIGVDIDKAGAVEWYRKAVATGDIWAKWRLGHCYLTGSGVEQDQAEAVRLFKEAQSLGDSGEEWRLGLCYQNGWGVESNLYIAGEFFKTSADYGNAEGQWRYGEWLRLRYAPQGTWDSGYGWERDKMVNLFRQSAEQGNAAGQTKLAECYERGDGVVKNLALAVAFYGKAVSQEYIPAYTRLAKVYLFQNGELSYQEEAVRLFRIAVDAGDPDAECALGVYQQYFTDLFAAVLRNKQACAQNCGEAKWRRGLCYKYGFGVQKDSSKAAQLFLDAALMGNAEAQYQMGLCLQDGVGVGINIQEAVKWYQKAVNQGHSGAQAQLGWWYASTSAFALSLYGGKEKARELYLLAAKQGDSDGQVYLGVCYQEGLGGSQDYRKAVNLFRQAATQNNRNGQFALANCYREGIGIAVNLEEAVKLYQKAAGQGHERAKEALKELGR